MHTCKQLLTLGAPGAQGVIQPSHSPPRLFGCQHVLWDLPKKKLLPCAKNCSTYICSTASSFRALENSTSQPLHHCKPFPFSRRHFLPPPPRGQIPNHPCSLPPSPQSPTTYQYQTGTPSVSYRPRSYPLLWPFCEDFVHHAKFDRFLSGHVEVSVHHLLDLLHFLQCKASKQASQPARQAKGGARAWYANPGPRPEKRHAGEQARKGLTKNRRKGNENSSESLRSDARARSLRRRGYRTIKMCLAAPADNRTTCWRQSIVLRDETAFWALHAALGWVDAAKRPSRGGSRTKSENGGQAESLR